MIYRTIRGVTLPALGFGTWQLFGDEALDATESALRVGYRHIDTAQGYDNEAEVGEAIKRSGIPRDQIFLVSKVKPDNFAGDRAARSTHESLHKLATDYVDLMLLHWPNPGVPLEQPLESLERLQRTGAVRHIGVSNFPPKLVRRAREVVDVFCNQVEYHPYLSQPGLLALVDELDMLLTAYAPVARGRVLDDEVMIDIGRRHGKSPAQVALRWLLQQDRVAAIPKAKHEEHHRENFDVFDFQLSDEEMAAIHGLNDDYRIVSPADGPDWER